MSISDPNLAKELALREHQLSALRAAFLVASHHGVALRPEDLPQLTGGDMVASVTASLSRAGLRVKLLQGCNERTAAGLGSAYPALIPMQDGAWVILIAMTEQDGAPVAAILDPAQEAQGVQIVPRSQFLAAWSGRILLVQRGAEVAAEVQPFGLSWFLPALRSQSRLMAGVAVAVIVGNLISFALPLAVSGADRPGDRA